MLTYVIQIIFYMYVKIIVHYLSAPMQEQFNDPPSEINAFFLSLTNTLVQFSPTLIDILDKMKISTIMSLTAVLLSLQ